MINARLRSRSLSASSSASRGVSHPVTAAAAGEFGLLAGGLATFGFWPLAKTAGGGGRTRSVLGISGGRAVSFCFGVLACSLAAFSVRGDDAAAAAPPPAPGGGALGLWTCTMCEGW